MKTHLKTLALIACASLAACGGAEKKDDTVPGEVVADQLDKAAEQSSQPAKEVLEKAADKAQQHDRLAPAGEPGSFAQDAMEDAAKASQSPTSEAT